MDIHPLFFVSKTVCAKESKKSIFPSFFLHVLSDLVLCPLCCCFSAAPPVSFHVFLLKVISASRYPVVNVIML